MLTATNAVSELRLLLTGEADCLSNGPDPQFMQFAEQQTVHPEKLLAAFDRATQLVECDKALSSLFGEISEADLWSLEAKLVKIEALIYEVVASYYDTFTN